MKPFLKIGLLLVLIVISTYSLPQDSKRRLDRGIADVQARIEMNNKRREALREEMSEHIQEMGKKIVSSYADKKDELRTLVELENAYDGVLKAAQNGMTGQVWPAVGNLGQALLDCFSDSECTPVPPQFAMHQKTIKGVNTAQGVAWDGAKLLETLSELDAVEKEINRDQQTEQTLEKKNTQATTLPDVPNENADVTAGPDPIPPTRPTGVDLSALDDAILRSRWMDVGNRIFANREEEDRFYVKFPELQKYRTQAETQSPATDAEKDSASSPLSNESAEPVPESCAYLVGYASGGLKACMYIACFGGCDSAAVSSCQSGYAHNAAWEKKAMSDCKSRNKSHPSSGGSDPLKRPI